MKVEIRPSQASGTVAAPPSKSLTHRALIAAALAPGTGTIKNVSPSEDIMATMDCLRVLGARIDFEENRAVVTGLSRDSIPDGAVLPCRDSGSTLRFLIPLALTSGKRITFTGSKRLFSRPLTVYEDICRRQGLFFEHGETSLTVQGVLSPGEYDVPGDVSSQFVSGLCYALSLLDRASRVALKPPVESRPYLEITQHLLADYGVQVSIQGDQILIPGKQVYLPRDYSIEGDWSNAAFPDALNLLGGSVEVTGLPDITCQGDRVYPRYFAALSQGTPTLDLSDCPDLGPVCFALSAALNGATFTGIRRLRLKESDRVAAMTEELAKFGVNALVTDDTVFIPGNQLHAPAGHLSGHNDHRIVMALAVLASQTGGVISDAEAVNKSYPAFWHDLENLGIQLTRNP